LLRSENFGSQQKQLKLKVFDGTLKKEFAVRQTKCSQFDWESPKIFGAPLSKVQSI
jgi:hypothetical protein